MTADDPFYLVDPREPAPGVLAVLVRQSRMQEVGDHERSRITQTWKVRGIVSDSVPLCGEPDASIARASHNLIFLNEDPLSIYLHSGGHRAVYYDLVGDEQHRLSFIEILVETRLPSNAIMLVRRPLKCLVGRVNPRFKHAPHLAEGRTYISTRWQNLCYIRCFCHTIEGSRWVRWVVSCRLFRSRPTMPFIGKP